MTSRRRGLRKDAPNLLDTSSEEEHEVVASTAVLLATPQKGEQQERGLPPSVRTKLFEAIESKGGVEVVTNSNRLLQSLCDEHPEVFGSPSNLNCLPKAGIYPSEYPRGIPTRGYSLVNSLCTAIYLASAGEIPRGISTSSVRTFVLPHNNNSELYYRTVFKAIRTVLTTCPLLLDSYQ